ncbi:MAG TPA: hypothetical protein VIK86_03595, partial [Candidatus Paceibacterota bacterium]
QQDYIRKNRNSIQDKDRVDVNAQKVARNSKIIVRANLTPHGLRYAYSAELYKKLRKKMSKEKAMKIVSVLLGHGRTEISKFYLFLALIEEQINHI